jgi:hypothetical protein
MLIDSDYSELIDRREAIRQQIIDECVSAMNRIITEHSVTHTLAERSFLLTAVMMRLTESLCLEMRTQMMGPEIE